MGRKKDSFWQHVVILEGKFKCKFCGEVFVGGASRIKWHLSGTKGKGIRTCDKVSKEVQIAAPSTFDDSNKRVHSNISSSVEDNLIDSDCPRDASKGGRKKDKIWKHVIKLDEKRVKCKYCEVEFAGGATRIKSHLHQIKNRGIKACTQYLQATNGSNDGRDKTTARPSNLEEPTEKLDDAFELSLDSWNLEMPSDDNKLGKKMEEHSTETLQVMTLQEVNEKRETETNQQESMPSNLLTREQLTNVGPFSVAYQQAYVDDLQLINYVFDPSLDASETIVSSPHTFLRRCEFTTLQPQGLLHELVINLVAEILTKTERKKKKTCLNWYLPLTFSRYAQHGEASYFKDYVERQKMRELYMSNLIDCEKMFIPIHIAIGSDGHFYLYVVYLKEELVEIWDSIYADEKEREGITRKVLLAMDKLFEDDIKNSGRAFANFRVAITMYTPKQTNQYDCGIFVIKFMQHLAKAKRNPSFKFESDEERLALALDLLKSDINGEREILHNKATNWYHGKNGEDGQLSALKRKGVHTNARVSEDVQKSFSTAFNGFNGRLKINVNSSDPIKNFDNLNRPHGLSIGAGLTGHTMALAALYDQTHCGAHGASPLVRLPCVCQLLLTCEGSGGSSPLSDLTFADATELQSDAASDNFNLLKYPSYEIDWASL